MLTEDSGDANRSVIVPVEVVDEAGDTFGFRTWGTTSSSSYQAVYNNFSYIVD